MDWLERLNQEPGRVALGAGRAELLQWAYEAYLPDNVPHRHTFFEVCQVGAWGTGLFIAHGREHALRPGDIFIARPGVEHQICNTGPENMELFWVSFQWVGAGEGERETARGETDALLRRFAEGDTLVAPDADSRLALLWQTLRAIAGGPRLPGHDAQLHALITALLLAIAQAGTDAPGSPLPDLAPGDASAMIARVAVRYVHDNLYRPLSVSEVAAHCHVSPRHLGRLFAQFAGTSPADYIARARLDRACGLLLHSETAIKEIARLVGFGDVHYFTRQFTRYTGSPPGLYRREQGASHVRIIQKPGALV